MKQAIFYLFLIGLISCSTNSQEKETADEEIINKSEPKIAEIDMPVKKQPIEYHEIVLSENSLDTFLIPLPVKNMLMPLRNYYKPYWVEANNGQQDGPDFEYIDIVRDEKNPVVYLNFDSENKFKLDEIRIVDSTAVDQYGVRVGDSYQKVIEKRKEDFKNSTNYHQHTYLYSEKSSIYYELTGNFTMTEEMLDNIEEIELTDEQLQKCRVEYIIWRKRK